MRALIVGDSHGRYFELTRQVRSLMPELAGVKARLKQLPGATIAGFGKRESTLNAKRVVTDLVDEHEPEMLILNFGQVDLELGIPYRHYVRRDASPVDEQLEGLSTTYGAFLSHLSMDPARVLVKGCNLPVLCRDRRKAMRYIKRIITENITDENEQKAVMDRMRRDFPTDEARTAMTVRFNVLLQEAVSAVGATYFDFNDRLRDPDTGLIAAEFIPAGRDHHLIDSITVRALHWEAALTAYPHRVGLPRWRKILTRLR